MGYKLELDLPNVGRGVEVNLEGLGIFKNPGTYEISTEEAEAFRIHHQKLVDDTDPESGRVMGHTTEIGPTVLQYFDSAEGINVSTLTKTQVKKESHPTSTNRAPQNNPEHKVTGGPQSKAPVVPLNREVPDDTDDTPTTKADKNEGGS